LATGIDAINTPLDEVAADLRRRRVLRRRRRDGQHPLLDKDDGLVGLLYAATGVGSSISGLLFALATACRGRPAPPGRVASIASRV
jgi:hypothetical protein